MDRLAVTNASPLIFLAKAGQLELLKLAGEQVVIPHPVFDEIAAYGPADLVIRQIAQRPWLKVVQVASISPVVQAWDLGRGESSVLALANEAPNTIAILDDSEARRCAATLRISIIGTLGLVMRAKRHKVISQARPVIDMLLREGMYLSPRIIASVLASIGE